MGSLGISRGKQNPLTASELFEMCVLPICLYGCENWLLTDSLLQLLENFQAEMEKDARSPQTSLSTGCFGMAIDALIHPQEKAELLGTIYAS